MNLRPHGHTVLVEPDLPPDKTDSGTIILPDDHFFIPTSGTVVAVGRGSKRDFDTRRKAYLNALACVPDGEAKTLLKKLADSREPSPSVCYGDRVVFAAEAGLTIKDEDGKDYILIDEDRIAIIVEERA